MHTYYEQKATDELLAEPDTFGEFLFSLAVPDAGQDDGGFLPDLSGRRLLTMLGTGSRDELAGVVFEIRDRFRLFYAAQISGRAEELEAEDAAEQQEQMDRWMQRRAA